MRILPWFVLIVVIMALAMGMMYGKLGAPNTELANATSTPSLEIERFTLSNGMEVILLPNDRAPAISHMLWLRVGASDDPYGKSGLAHYHEHLMFKGTPQVPLGEFSKQLEAIGGEFNAFTSNDFTGFYANVAKEHLETVMILESDRFQQLTPSEEDYTKELEVIVEERQTRVGSNPSAMLSEQMQATLYQHHPYRIPVIGWMHEIKGLTAEDAKDFYDTHYHAGNIVLIVAGDVTREQLEPLAERYYGILPKAPANRRDWLQEPPAEAAKTLTLHHPEVTQPRWQRRYLVPSYGNSSIEQCIAISLLSEWLGGGKTSLLYQSLVKEQQLAVSVNASYYGFNVGPTQFLISATPADGVSLEELEAAIDQVLEKARNERISKADLKRYKTIYNASAVYARDGLMPLAQYAGYLAMLDVPMTLITDWERYVDQVSAKQLHDATQIALKPQGSVTGYLLPQTPEVSDE